MPLARICPFGGIPYRESPVRMGAEVGWNEPLAASVRCLGCYSLTGAPPTLLNAIARSRTPVGVVSGRSLEDVRSRVGFMRIWYVGAHGYFLQDPANRTVCLESPKEERRDPPARTGWQMGHHPVPPAEETATANARPVACFLSGRQRHRRARL